MIKTMMTKEQVNEHLRKWREDRMMSPGQILELVSFLNRNSDDAAAISDFFGRVEDHYDNIKSAGYNIADAIADVLENRDQ